MKEPIAPEFDYMRPGQVLFTCLHLAANRTLAERLLEKKIVGVACETVQLPDGSLPLLAPMSEVAGALCLDSRNGGRGVLLSGAPGVKSAKVTVLGGGRAGRKASSTTVLPTCPGQCLAPPPCP